MMGGRVRGDVLRGVSIGKWNRTPSIPVQAEPDPEHSVCRPERRLRPLPLKHRKLVTEDGVLGRQGGAGSSQAREGTKDQREP